MFHKGVRTSGGDLSKEDASDVERLLDQFIELVDKKATALRLRRAVVRSLLPCTTLHLLDSRHLFVAAQKQAAGMPSTVAFDRKETEFSTEQVREVAKWELGFDEPFVVSFPVHLLNNSNEGREPELSAIADAHVTAELNRVEREMSIIQVNPLFGPASYPVDPRLAFVLMPFADDLTQIYNSIIKPAVEHEEFGLVCRRADEIKSNKVIIQDIWKSICEARVVIADLTGQNPNVMYELGIAHTLGKETVLMYRRGGDVGVPFDLAHIRRIEYKNDAPGGKRLENDLRKTLSAILAPKVSG